MSFNVCINKNEEPDMKMLAVEVVTDISVSVAAAIAGDLLLIFDGFATSLADHLIFLYEADTKLSTCSFDKALSLVSTDFVYRLPLNLRLVYNDVPPLFAFEKQQLLVLIYIHINLDTFLCLYTIQLVLVY